MEEVILVNEQDEQVGSMEKMEAHYQGVLHRAFSVFIFNDRGEMLLQQRATSKYHSGGLWTNACCSHPRVGEATDKAACRRLQEELGFSTTLQKIFDFRYNVSFSNGLKEHEFDHVFSGNYSGKVYPNAAEVQDYCFKNMMEIAANIENHANKYTAWFCIAFPKVLKWWKSQGY
jgi:isopentenyl-diphosphate delta-isomerase